MFRTDKDIDTFIELMESLSPERSDKIDLLSALLHACEYISNSHSCPLEAGFKMPTRHNCAAECVNGKEHICWKEYFVSLGSR